MIYRRPRQALEQWLRIIIGMALWNGLLVAQQTDAAMQHIKLSTVVVAKWLERTGERQYVPRPNKKNPKDITC